ncbi:hypothetical protein D6C87_05971 [Aureobasidium pullulans]|nr:hypothetical protein D6C87_05971 [Aureobasidium pullulans]
MNPSQFSVKNAPSTTMASSAPSPVPLGMSEPLDNRSITELLAKYEAFKILDNQKKDFFDRLVQERSNFELERTWLKQQLASAGQTGDHDHSSLEQNPYVLVLIDGNELIFRNAFLGQGDQGGRRAAQALFQATNEFAFSTIHALPDNTKIVLKIYVDLEDLCSIGLRTGLVSNGNQIKTFVRGFCQDKNLFDVIDVGMQGRAVVFDKMEENLAMYIFDKQCKHIVFGCEDGEIYAPILKRFTEKIETTQRVTLLHGTEPDRYLAALHIDKTQMNDIFRNTKMDIHKLVDHVAELDSVPALLMESVTPPLSSPATSRSGSRTAVGTARTALPSIAHSRQDSASSISSAISGVQVKPKENPWILAAKKGAAVKTPPKDIPKEKEQWPTDYVRRNKKGQRIDPPTPEFKKDEVNRLKKLKLCNAHHLRHDCPYPEGKCEHDHVYKCNPKELETLKLVARMSACIHGAECSDPKCIYGHRCPFPEAREGSMRGKACINGENCRFPAEMHNMDIVPVRRLKIT